MIDSFSRSGKLVVPPKLDKLNPRKMITEEEFNHVISTGSRKSESVAFWLSSPIEGLELHARDDYRLTKLISEETLNTFITEGANKGVSVVLCPSVNYLSWWKWKTDTICTVSKRAWNFRVEPTEWIEFDSDSNSLWHQWRIWAPNSI